jgi:hypothetical protein
MKLTRYRRAGRFYGALIVNAACGARIGRQKRSNNMPKERKEYAVGGTPSEATQAFDELHGYKFGKWCKGGNVGFEVVRDDATGLYQIFRERRRRDRTVKRPIRRDGTHPVGTGKNNRPLVLILLPGEQMVLKLKGCRIGYQVAWEDVYHWRARVEAQAVINERNRAKSEKAKAQADRIRKREAKRAAGIRGLFKKKARKHVKR